MSYAVHTYTDHDTVVARFSTEASAESFTSSESARTHQFYWHDATIHGCCQLPTFKHEHPCHDCSAVEAPIHPDSWAQRGEPVCVNCVRMGAFAA